METVVCVVRTVYVVQYVCYSICAGAKILIFLFLNSLNLEFVEMMCKIAVVYLKNTLCGQYRLY